MPATLREPKFPREGFQAVASFSGGLDSTVLLSALVLRYQAHRVLAVSTDYGQRHKRELEAARDVCESLGVRHLVVDISGLGQVFQRLGSGSSLVFGSEVPNGHYAQDNMKKTIVPNRNLILLAIAGGCAVSWGAEHVFTAVHGGDHFIYPDCRPEFIEVANLAIRAGTKDETEGDGPQFVGLEAPFLSWTKAEIARYGHEIKAPMHLSWSCYKGGSVHCSSCGTCYERRESFEEAGVPDPTEYALSESEWRKFREEWKHARPIA